MQALLTSWQNRTKSVMGSDIRGDLGSQSRKFRKLPVLASEVRVYRCLDCQRHPAAIGRTTLDMCSGSPLEFDYRRAVLPAAEGDGHPKRGREEELITHSLPLAADRTAHQQELQHHRRA